MEFRARNNYETDEVNAYLAYQNAINKFVLLARSKGVTAEEKESIQKLITISDNALKQYLSETENISVIF